MCTLLYTTFTHFAVSQSVLQNQFTELRPSEITLMNRVDQSQGFKLSLTEGMIESPNVVIAQPKGCAIRKLNISSDKKELQTI